MRGLLCVSWFVSFAAMPSLFCLLCVTHSSHKPWYTQRSVENYGNHLVDLRKY